MIIEIKLDPEKCKSCKLCVWTCPKKDSEKVLEVSKNQTNKDIFLF